MVVSWNEAVEKHHENPSTIPGAITATDCQTDFLPKVIVIHHIKNGAPRFQNNDIFSPALKLTVKDEKMNVRQIDDIPFIDEDELESSKEKIPSKSLVQR